MALLALGGRPLEVLNLRVWRRGLAGEEEWKEKWNRRGGEMEKRRSGGGGEMKGRRSGGGEDLNVIYLAESSSRPAFTLTITERGRPAPTWATLTSWHSLEHKYLG